MTYKQIKNDHPEAICLVRAGNPQGTKIRPRTTFSLPKTIEDKRYFSWTSDLVFYDEDVTAYCQGNGIPEPELYSPEWEEIARSICDSDADTIHDILLEMDGKEGLQCIIAPLCWDGKCDFGSEEISLNGDLCAAIIPYLNMEEDCSVTIYHSHILVSKERKHYMVYPITQESFVRYLKWHNDCWQHRPFGSEPFNWFTPPDPFLPLPWHKVNCVDWAQE